MLNPYITLAGNDGQTYQITRHGIPADISGGYEWIYCLDVNQCQGGTTYAFGSVSGGTARLWLK